MCVTAIALHPAPNHISQIKTIYAVFDENMDFCFMDLGSLEQMLSRNEKVGYEVLGIIDSFNTSKPHSNFMEIDLVERFGLPQHFKKKRRGKEEDLSLYTNTI